MPLNIRSEAVNQLAGQLADVTKTTKTGAVLIALQNELRRRSAHIPLRERLKPLQARVSAVPATGHAADKAFYDSLEGDL